MSSRLQPRRSVKTVLNYYEDALESDDGYDSDNGHRHGHSALSPRRSKTKLERSGSEAKQTGRRRSGRLSKFPAMPLDVMYEVCCLGSGWGPMLTSLATQIFSLLHPRDLLRVSWTTKAFRGVLTDRSSKPIWKTSLATVDELPPCPTDLAEPAYAALLFCPYCSVRSGLLTILAWADSSKYCRDVRNRGRLWSGSFGGGFVNRALRMRTLHNSYH